MASSTASAQHDTTETTPAKKRFVPLENNPEVMTSLIHKLGLKPTLAFQDVYSLEDPGLLAFVPRPAYALLLVFPVSPAYEKFRHEEDASRADYTGAGDGEEVVWFKQTIGNACGLIGLLHGACNGSARTFIAPESDLDVLLKKAIPLPPGERATLLETSDALESAHSAAAATGNTAAPAADDRVDLHYVCFVKNEETGHLWEMDGRRKGPLLRGKLSAADDVLSDPALEIGVKAFIRREEEAGGDLRFSLIVLSPALE